MALVNSKEIYDILEINDALKSVKDDSKTVMYKCESIIQENEKAFKEYEETADINPNYDTYIDTGKWYEKCSNEIASVAYFCSEIHNRLADICGHFSGHDKEYPTSVFGKISENSDEVSIIYSDDFMIVKTPNLTSSYLKGRNKMGNPYVLLTKFYCPEISSEIRNNMDKIPRFEEKNISILSVYPDNSRKIPDANNLDTKRIVDAVTQFMPGADDAYSTSFFEMNLKSNDIKSGTYFVITNRFGSPFPAKNPIEFLRKNGF